MSNEIPITSFNDLLRQLLSLLLSGLAANWRGIWVRLARIARRLFRRRPVRGLYQILDYDTTLELVDAAGKVALFRRRQKVRFLQDHVIAYQDEAWGDGDVVADYRCSPGVPVDHFQVGSRHLILISLRETKNRGDVVEFNIERRVKGGFTQHEEWLEAETRYPTRRLRLRIIFPKGRECQRAKITERRGEKTATLGEKNFGRRRDGRQTLTWSKRRPAQGESYTISWVW